MQQWICPKEYEDLKPVNNYFRQFQAKKDANSPFVNVHTLYRKTFDVETLKRTIIRITADDYYKLYINGIFVTQGPANAYHFVYNLNEIDITSYLQEGENVIAVDNLYNGYICRAYNSGDNRMGLYAQILQDGQSLMETDETWKYMFDKSYVETDKTHGYDTQAAEYRNMMKYPHGWTELLYDDSKWCTAVVKKDDDHQCVMQETPNVAGELISAENVTVLSKTRFVLDFGKEVVGNLVIDVCGGKGHKIVTRFGEELKKDGSVRHKMRCNIDYDEYIILSGKQDYIENYEYKAFRYVEIKTRDSAVTPDCVKVRVRNYPVNNKMIFSSNQSLLEDIWRICENAVIISSQEAYLDCPSREKGQYLGDLLITALAHSYITGDTRLYKKALSDFANSAFIDEGLMAVVPGNYMQEIADYSLLYPKILLNYFHLTGDGRFVSTLLPVAEKTAEHFKQYAREDGLLEQVTGKWNMVDWPQNLRDNYDFTLSQPIGKGCHNVINAYYYGALCTINELRVLLGLEEKYETEPLKAAYYNAFYRKDKQMFSDSETSDHCNFHSNVLPLYFGMCEKENKNTIIKFITNKGLCCGVYFSYFVLKALAKEKCFEEVYQLLTNETIHSWKNMLDEGATAAFEAWGKEQKKNTSLCHPWGSSPIIIILEDLLGYVFEKGNCVKCEEHLPEDVAISVRGGLLKGRVV